MEKYGVIEIFAGIAGLAQGFQETRKFFIQGLIDIDHSAHDSFKLNFPNVKYLNEDIRKSSPRKLLNQTGNNRPFVVLGCPPCQGLSAAGTRSPWDHRNRFIYEFFNYVDFIRPKVFVLENVPQVLEKAKYKELIDEFAKQKKYQIWSGVLNCALYGLPQTRQRAVVIGYHNSIGLQPKPPAPTHYGDMKIYSYSQRKYLRTDQIETFEKALGWYANIKNQHGRRLKSSEKIFQKYLKLKPLVTLEEALSDLPSLRSGDQRYLTAPQNDYQREMRKGSVDEITEHLSWGHSVQMKKRISKVPEGGVEFAKRTHRGRSRSYFSQAYGRLHRLGLSRTITGNFHNPGCGRFIHYQQNRTLTLREASRLQGFEDWFKFSGWQADKRRIIGNAFPKKLAKTLAFSICNDLFNLAS